MGGTNYQINENFEAASTGLTPEQRACHVITAFTTGTVCRSFDAEGLRVDLSRSERLDQYMMEVELLPGYSGQNELSFLNLAESLLKSIKTLQDEAFDEPFAMNVGSAERGSKKHGFVLATPNLNEFTALFANISERLNQTWGDAKLSAKIGREYSLVDLEQVIALIPQNDNEDAFAEMDRPLDLGLPKARLQ